VIRKSFQSGVDSIACDRYFYDHDKLDEYFGGQVIESSFGEFEGQIAPIINTLINRIKTNDFVEFEKDEKESLAEFLYYQLIRTKENRIAQEQLHNLMKEELLGRGFSTDQLKEYGFVDSYDSKQKHLEKIVSVEEMKKTLNEFSGRIWILVNNVSKYEFYTSDDPVVKHSHSDRGHLGYELFLPLTPRVAVMVLIRKAFKDFERFDNQLMPFSEKEWVKWYNHLQIIQSTRQIYSVVSNFKFAEKFVTENPSIADLDRPRVTSMFKR